MNLFNPLPIPAYVITGTLGIGKTSLIIKLLKQRPPDERWAVIVNEFGNVSVDDALLSEGQDEQQVSIHSMPGGCLCCSSCLPMEEVIPEAIRKLRPHRLIIEPSGLAHMGQMLDTLQHPPLNAYVTLQRVITMMNPRGVLSPRFPMTEAIQIMLDTADDVLLAKSDRSDPDKRKAAAIKLRAAIPPTTNIHKTTEDLLNSAWMDLTPAHARIVCSEATSTSPLLKPERMNLSHPGQPGCYPSHDGIACGWIFPEDTTFDTKRLHRWLTQRSCDFRIKGILKTNEGKMSVNCMGEECSIRLHSAHTSLPCLEIIAPGNPPDWSALEIEITSLLEGV